MMKIYLSVFVFILFYFSESLVFAKNSATYEQARFSKVRYLITQAENDAETSRPLFYWESAPITTSSTENSQFEITFPISNTNKLLINKNDDAQNKVIDKKRKTKLRKKKRKNKLFNELIETETNLMQPTKTEKNKKRRHKGKRKRKRKQRRKNRKNKKGLESNVLEIPKTAKNITNVLTWNIKNDLSIQEVISKLNKNPESSYENLFGKGVTEDEVKISYPKLPNRRINVSSPSLPNLNAFGVNSNDNKNDSGILLEPRQKETDRTAAFKKKGSYKAHFYEPSFMNTSAPAVEESIFKESEDKISNKNENTWTGNYNAPKINYSELMKPTKVKQINNPKNIYFLNSKNEGNYNNNNVLQTNQVLNEYFGNIFTKNKSRNRGYCNIKNGGCAHFCSEYKSQKCSCLEGFILGEDGRTCYDIDECLRNNGDCESLCYNILGSYYCGCPAGLRIGDDLKSCEDINECILRNGHGPCQDICTNTFGSYYCDCSDLNGTRLAEDKHACEDVNECKEGKSGCSHGCINTHGRAFCTCPNGMELGKDWKTCYDINECEDEEIQKQCKYGCLNTVGSYHCLDLKNEQNDQIPTAPENISCPPMLPPRHGFFDCSRKKIALGGFKTKDGRMRITNRPGTFCELVCPTGFKNVGDFRVFCGYDGRWTGQRKGKCAPYPKPKIKCPGPLSILLNPGEEIAYVKLPPPKASVDWKYVESEPVSAKNLEMFLPSGHHWITFKATNPSTQLSTKCIIYIVIRKTKSVS